MRRIRGHDARSARRWSDVLVGAATVLVVFVAVPAVLVALVGSPVPHPWRTSTVVTWRGLLDLLSVVAWLAWVACCWPIVGNVIRRVRAREVTSGPPSGWTDRLAARIAAGILVLAPVGGIATAAGGVTPGPTIEQASAAPPPGSLAGSLATAEPAFPVTPGDAPAAPDAPAPPALPGQYAVQPGDSLWSIADALYGDGGDWEVLARANLGRTMDGGEQFSDPSLIRPGWVLVVPALSSAPGAAPVPQTTAEPTPTEPAPARLPPAETPAARDRAGAPSALEAVGPARRPSGGDVGRRAGRGTPRAPARRPAPLPELAALGLGAVVVAALARRARRVRLARALEREEGDPLDWQSDAAEETASLMKPFEAVPALDWLERGNRLLSLALSDVRRPVPAVVCLRIGPDGISALLGEDTGWAPPGWSRRGARWWHLAPPLDRALSDPTIEGSPPWVPLLLPLGDNDEGAWFACLEGGSCLPVVGASAGDLVAAMVESVASWSWAGCIRVTGRPDVVEDARRTAGGGPSGGMSGGSDLLFVGDPDALSTEARGSCAVVTTEPRPATHLLVAADGGLASLHPLGVTLLPHRLDPGRREAVRELLGAPRDVECPDPEPPTPAHVGSPPSPVAPTQSQPPLPLLPASSRAVRRLRNPAPVDPPTGTPSPEPTAGAIGVRLLVAEPRLEGLAGELPPKRARRATELVAYLALHHPDPVTSDRLRTRVLGSPDADAAAKTLFNTVGAARRAMGADLDGRPHFPPATKAGHYRLGPGVTTDVERALLLVDAADASDDPDEVMALLRGALELVEDEPLSRVYSGYAWWQAEGHERRIAGPLVDAACRLARLASAAGHPGLARWGIEQARLVEPYSEALCRAAMQAAADAGDTDRLRQEWLECKRRVDELDPGSVPSESTEELYEDLRRRLPTTGRTG